jgi:threonine/homoserine/homoserine lactone efflux protein
MRRDSASARARLCRPRASPIQRHSRASSTTSSNPKVALFYLTFLPQFINPGDNVLLKSLLLAGIHVTLGIAWLTTYAYAIDRLGLLVQNARRWLERASGAALIALGIRLAFERR